MSRRVSESLRPVSLSSWSLGDNIILSRQQNVEGRWRDNDGRCYSISTEDRLPTPPGSFLPVPFPLIYDAGCGLRLDFGHAVWKIGNAFLKVLATGSLSDTTREHITLQALCQRNVAFSMPDVLFHGEWEGRYHIVTSEVPGLPLQRAWWSMSEEEKEACICNRSRNVRGSGGRRVMERCTSHYKTPKSYCVLTTATSTHPVWQLVQSVADLTNVVHLFNEGLLISR